MRALEGFECADHRSGTGEVCAARILRAVASTAPYDTYLAPYMDLADLARRIDHPASDLFLGQP